MKQKKKPEIDFHDEDCIAYTPIYEIQKMVIGSTAAGPIYSEKDIVVNTYCSATDRYDFNCRDCPVYIAKEKAKKQNVDEK